MEKTTWEWHPLNVHIKALENVDAESLKAMLSTGKWIALAYIAAESGDKYLIARVRD